MTCRYCSVALSSLRNSADGEFCCEEHRRAYSESNLDSAANERAPASGGSAGYGGLFPLAQSVSSFDSPADASQVTGSSMVEVEDSVAEESTEIEEAPPVEELERRLEPAVLSEEVSPPAAAGPRPEA